MKNTSIYTLILAKNQNSTIKTIHFEKKYLYIVLGCIATGILLLSLFLMDYVSLNSNQWKLAQLQTENKKLKNKLINLKDQFQDLEKTIHQISSFSKTIQMITTGNVNQKNHIGFNRIHSDAVIQALAKPQIKRGLSSINENQKDTFQAATHAFKNNDFDVALEVQVQNIAKQGELLKENTWTLYTDLLQKQEILNNTPSISPVKGWLSSGFGYRNESIYSNHEPYFHRGIDLASGEGSPILAPSNGKIVYAGYNDSGYGNLIIIDHGYGLKTYYAHLASIYVKIGESVNRRQVIGSVGNTGHSKGAHLHYEVRLFGTAVNPENYILDQENVFL